MNELDSFAWILDANNPGIPTSNITTTSQERVAWGKGSILNFNLNKIIGLKKRQARILYIFKLKIYKN